MSTADSDSYTYHRLVREEAQSYAVGGSISGLDAGETITLSLNSEEHTISANGDFAFPTLVSDLDAFYVSIALAPTGKSCAVANGEGNIESAAITNVMVTCSP